MGSCIIWERDQEGGRGTSQILSIARHQSTPRMLDPIVRRHGSITIVSRWPTERRNSLSMDEFRPDSSGQQWTNFDLLGPRSGAESSQLSLV
ncbi:hypothetical protein TNCV_967071 [Trichonephila clavipes]|nr:hypothetical protein TNCV_967071 [Trichonephila clavipes]